MHKHSKPSPRALQLPVLLLPEKAPSAYPCPPDPPNTHTHTPLPCSFLSFFSLKKRGVLPGLCQANDLISRDEGINVEFHSIVYS